MASEPAGAQLGSKEPSSERPSNASDSHTDGQRDNGPEAAVGNDERCGYSAQEIYHNQFWLNHVQIGKACRIAVDTAVCAAVLEPNPEGLESYINSAFNISDQQKKKIQHSSISRQVKTCRLILSCRIIKALRLAPINATENSNPYILLGVIPSKCIGDKVTKHGLLSEGQEGGFVGDIFRSSTQLSTLQPSWNEQFDIPLQDRDTDTLVIEMWNSKEPAITNISQVKDLKGFAKYLGYQVKLSSMDALIGWTYCSAKTVCLQGNEMTLGLTEILPGRKCGSVTMHLSISAKCEHNRQGLMDESHGLLYKALVMKESEQLSKCRQERFPSILSNHGEDLLHLHASYNGLSKLHEYSVRLSVLLSYHTSCPFLPSVFLPIVDSLIAEYHLFCKDKLAVSDEIHKRDHECQSEEIANQFQALLDESKKVLCDHLTMIDLSNAPGLQVLEDHVLLLVKLYTIDDLVGRLPSEEKSIQNVMSTFIKQSVENWFSKSVENQGDEVLLKDTMEQCITLCDAVRFKIGPTIQKHINVDYFTIFIVTMDGLLSMHTRQLCNRDVSQDEQLANILRDIYFLLKGIYVYILSITDPSVHGQLQVHKYQSWFRPIVPIWLQNISNNCNTKISRSMDLDEFSTSVTQEVKFSSSSCDTLTFLHEMKEFWGKLHWPPCEDTFNFCISIAKYIIQGALNYVDKLCSVWPQYFRSINATQVNVTQQLCVLISNIEHICEELRPTPTSSSSEKKLWTIELDPGTEQTTTDLWQQTKSTIQSNFQQASDSCFKKLLTIYEQMSYQFEPTIIVHIKDLVNQDLIMYMDTNLTCLRTNLLDPTFDMILQKVWTSVVHAFDYSGFRNDCLNAEEYRKIKDTLLALHGTFLGKGKGLPENQLDTEEYKALVNEVQRLSRPTHDLVLDFCADLARQQAETSPDGNLGTMGLSVGYIKSQSVLEVTIVGSNLNCNGSLYLDWDILPRISTRTKPRRLLNTQKTSDKKQNFSEEFKLSLNEDMMRTEGSVVILGLHNQKKDGLIGICIVPCKDIPTVTTDAGTLLNDHGSSRMRYNLALFQVKESKTMQELERRQKSDHDASVFLLDFHKKYMHLNNDLHPVSRLCNIM